MINDNLDINALLDSLSKVSNIIYIILIIGFLSYVIIKFIIIPTTNRPKRNIKVKSRKKATGIIFGKFDFRKLAYSHENDEGHVAVFGGTGLGKTTAILIPTLKYWKNGTAFVIDISGDISKNVAMRNKIVYEPENPKTTPYNIFAEIDQTENTEDKDELLAQLAILLMPDNPKNTDTSLFFNTEGRKILTSALICYYHNGLDFIEICETINKYSWRDLLNDIASHKNNKANSYISSFMGANDQNNAGCKQATDKAIDLFVTNNKIKNSIRRPAPDKSKNFYSPAQLENNNVFVIIEDNKLKLYSPLLRIITAQSLEYFSKRKSENRHTILFCLDEFASFGKLELTDALRKLRKKHIRIMVLTQSMADIDLIYGRDERMAMMNNYSFKIILSCEDSDTQEYFSKLIGERKVKKTSVSKNDMRTTYSESEQFERIIPPSDLGQLGKSLILISRDGHIKLKKNFFYAK